MANLIITIISIALVAVAALMAVWYGGSAFQAAQAKAKANALIQGGQQVVAAFRARRAMTGPQTQIWSQDTDNYGGFTGLVPTYLSNAPSLPEDIIEVSNINSNSEIYGWKITNQTIVDNLGNSFGFRLSVFVSFKNNDQAMEVCKKINEIAGLTGANPPSAYPSSASDPGYYNWYTATKNFPFHCNYRDPDNNGTYSYSAGAEYIRVIFFIN